MSQSVRKIEQLKKKSLMNLKISSMYLFWSFNARLMQLIKLRPIFFLLFPPFPKNMSRTYVNSNASRYYIKQKMLRGKKTKNVISEVSSTTNDLLLPPITQGYYVLMRYYIRKNWSSFCIYCFLIYSRAYRCWYALWLILTYSYDEHNKNNKIQIIIMKRADIQISPMFADAGYKFSAEINMVLNYILRNTSWHIIMIYISNIYILYILRQHAPHYKH